MIISSAINRPGSHLLYADSSDTDLSLTNSTNAYSLTRNNHAGSTEVISIPEWAMSNTGDLVKFSLRGRITNNEGNTRALTPQLTIGGALVADTGAAVGLSTSASSRGWGIDIEVIRITSTQAYCDFRMVFSNVGSAGSAVGLPTGSLGSPAWGWMVNNGFTLGSFPLSLVLTVAWPVASDQLVALVRRRYLRKM